MKHYGVTISEIFGTIEENRFIGSLVCNCKSGASLDNYHTSSQDWRIVSNCLVEQAKCMFYNYTANF